MITVLIIKKHTHWLLYSVHKIYIYMCCKVDKQAPALNNPSTFTTDAPFLAVIM